MTDVVIAAVRKGWADASSVAPGGRLWRAVRIAGPHPIAVLAGVKECNRAQAVLFEAAIEHAPAERARFEAEGIAMLEERDFADRIYRVSVSLERRDLENIFCIVAADLIEAAERELDATLAIMALFSRLSAWQAFLKVRRSGLGREAVIGLVGELLFARHLSGVAGLQPAVDAWKGPVRGLHDFLRHSHAVEVKTTAGVAPLIEVSTLDQLEDIGLSALLLAHIRLVEAPTGLTLPTLVSALRDDIQRSAPASLRPFSDALLAAGYADVDAEIYGDLAFQLVDITFYRVREGFPRLTRAAVPIGVTDARYRLDARALQPYLIDQTAVNGLLREMGDDP